MLRSLALLLLSVPALLLADLSPTAQAWQDLDTQRFDAAALSQSAQAFEACSATADCALKGAHAAWLLSQVLWSQDDKAGSRSASAQALRLAEGAWKALSPSVQARAMLVDALAWRAYSGGVEEAMPMGFQAYQLSVGLPKSPSATAQVLAVRGRLGLRIAGLLGGGPVKAESHFRAALAERPQDSLLWAGLGQALAEQRKKKEARAALEKALQLEPANPLAQRALKRLK